MKQQQDTQGRGTDTFPTHGVFDQGVRDWVRWRYSALRDAGMPPQEARRQTTEDANAAFGYWRAS